MEEKEEGRERDIFLELIPLLIKKILPTSNV